MFIFHCGGAICGTRYDLSERIVRRLCKEVPIDGLTAASDVDDIDGPSAANTASDKMKEQDVKYEEDSQ